MGAPEIVFGGAMSIIAWVVIVVAVYKIFAIQTELSEIKEIVKDIKLNTEDKSPDAFNARLQSQSPAPLMQAVNAASYSTAEIDSASEVGKQ